MTRGPYRRAISFVLSWNAISNAQTTSKINLPPINGEPSAPLVKMLDFPDFRGIARDEFLFPRASPTSGSDDNDSASPTPSSLSSPPSTLISSRATSSISTQVSPTSDSGIDIPTIHSPVPMVAGSLAGFIAILAAVLVIIIVRRRKTQSMSRTDPPPLPPFMAGPMPRGVELEIYPTASPHSGGRPRTTHPKSSKKRSSRYDYTIEDLELGFRDSDSLRGRSDTTHSRHPSNFTGESGYSRRYSSGRRRPSQPGIGSAHAHASTSVNREESDPFDPTLHTTTPQSHTHGEMSPSALGFSSPSPFSSNNPTASEPDNASFLPPSNSRSNTHGLDPDVSSAFSTSPAILRAKGEDLPPAYEDVR